MMLKLMLCLFQENKSYGVKTIYIHPLMSRDRTSLRHVWHITLSQGKKRDEVKDEDDDDVVRISVSQDKVKATMCTLCTEELFPCTQHI